MTDYANGKNVLLKRPEPGRPVHPVVSEKKEASQNVDTNAIADAVIKAIVGKMPRGGIVTTERQVSDGFDDSASLEKLAKVMAIPVQEGSNVEGIGKVKEVKKDQKEVDKAIDILSKLGD